MEIFSPRTAGRRSVGASRRSFLHAGGVLLILFAGDGVVGCNDTAGVPVLQSVLVCADLINAASQDQAISEHRTRRLLICAAASRSAYARCVYAAAPAAEAGERMGDCDVSVCDWIFERCWINGRRLSPLNQRRVLLTVLRRRLARCHQVIDRFKRSGSYTSRL